MTVAEIGQASDITLFVFVLVLAVVVGLALLALEAMVDRLQRRRRR
jgi:hypothetical protein